MTSTILRTSLMAAAIAPGMLLFAGSARAQNPNQGPMAPPPTFEAHRMPSTPKPGPPPIPQEQIVQKLAANEDAAQRAYAAYDFTETIRIEEVDGGGKFTVVGDSYVKPDGQRYWRVTKPPVSTLQLTTYQLDDVRPIMTIPLFFLTSDHISEYDFVYLGQQKLDDLNTYILQVKPKRLNRAQRFFDGIVYVDDQDLAIVESFGKFVSEIGGSGTPLPFSMYEVFRQNFQQKYWLPTYIRSDDYTGGDQLHLRLVVRSTDFKPNAAAVPAPMAPNPSTSH